MTMLKIIHLAISILLLLSTLIYTTLPSKFSKVKLFLLIEETILCVFSLVILIFIIIYLWSFQKEADIDIELE